MKLGNNAIGNRERSKCVKCIITSTLDTHLGEHVEEGVCVGVDHWRDVRDAARHVRLHDRHLDKGAN